MADVAADYREFGEVYARGVSPLYEELSYGVAADSDLLALLSELPPGKRQPNLLYAAARFAFGVASDFAEFRRGVLDRRDAVVATMLARRTQTNEPARCASLYPLLARLPQPVALLEVGASAGLCLQPDRYRYDYDGVPAGDPDSPLLLRCRVAGSPPPGTAGELSVAWRAGIDLNPLDITDPDDVRWLETLIWPGPGHDERAGRLRAAVEIARRDPPRVVPGDLNDLLPALADEAPSGATLVVCHTAAIAYLSGVDRRRFIDVVRGLPGRWISQEAPTVISSVAGHLRGEPPHPAMFAMAFDGEPVAYTAPHGGVIHWLSR
ncbi:MAG: DUF2332 family protein [Micromonosporaceae bacterium]|nr:DUF2332 family protein [Micromonosporaceae bacterium]